MSHVRIENMSAPLTPEGRRRWVECVLDDRWFGVSVS